MIKSDEEWIHALVCATRPAISNSRNLDRSPPRAQEKHMNLKEYKHREFTYQPNKFQIEPIEMAFSDYEKFNEVYLYAKDHFRRIEPTKSHAMPHNRAVDMYDRYMIVQSANKIELTIVCHMGCYRFVIGNRRDEEKNPISGKAAVREIYRLAKELNIDLSKYKVDSEQGEKIKETINAPHIKIYGATGLVHCGVHHLDLNSSYASRIVEKYPEFEPLYNEMYNKRHQKNEYYKHVLTNHIGCWQSPYCPDVDNKGKLSPYQFANLSKVAVNGTYEMICKYVEKLKEAGREVLLTNTDGIWYKGDLYHDENEGTQLGQWKNDHVNCQFIMKSKGAYQFIEDGVCHSVVRGLTLLDREKDRSLWEFGDIFNENAVEEYYAFDADKGVIKNVKKI